MQPKRGTPHLAQRRLLLGPAIVLMAACSAPRPEVPERVAGHCVYFNRFSNQDECVDFLGEWADEAVVADCADRSSTAVLGEACEVESILGWCLLEEQRGLVQRVAFPGSDESKCGSMRTGCQLFARGYFEPGPVCGGRGWDDAGTGLPTFRQPRRVCTPPKDDRPGRSEDGLVCTWEMISGATEEGRLFSDYASCETVLTQRPYFPAPENARVRRDEPRLRDPGFVAELEWVRGQIRSSACICCHSNEAPRGASNWNVDTPGNFVAGFHPRGLAMGAGWIDTVGFGAYPPEENNGFVRPTPEDPHHSIVPATDPVRMMAFFARELQQLGYSRDDFREGPPGAGPLDDQRFFRPGRCEEGERIDPDGTLHWRFGAARYLYVLAADATSPTVPPNLDLPEGTLWRIDVPEEGAPLASGTVRYGEVPAGARQRFPSSGSPAPLEPGRSYYLYVLADVAVPVTRCLVEAP